MVKNNKMLFVKGNAYFNTYKERALEVFVVKNIKQNKKKSSQKHNEIWNKERNIAVFAFY